MEALHACSVAALTIYDMCKSADRGMVIGDLALWEKTGGRSGNYRRADSVTDSVTNVVDRNESCASVNLVFAGVALQKAS